MLKRYSQALAAVALALVGGAAYAQQAAQPAISAVDCNACATPCTSGGSFYGSVGVLYLKSTANSNNAYSSFDTPFEDGTTLSSFSTISDFNRRYDFAYRTEFGYTTDCGWGGRLRWFSFVSADSISVLDNQQDFAGPGSGVASVKATASPLGLQFSTFGDNIDPSTLVVETRVRVKTWDLELTRNTRCGCLDLTWSAGVRYLQIDQDYNALERLNAPASTLDRDIRVAQTIISNHTMNGIGPILGLEGRHTLWDNLRVYGLGRVGFIFCDGHHQAWSQVEFNPEFQIDPVNSAAEEFRSRMVTTAEVEMGLEYAHELCSGSEVYVRGGVNGMVFGGVGNASRSAIGAPPDERKNENLALWGFNVSVGFRY